MSLEFVDPDNYESQLDAKKDHLTQLFSTFELPKLECFASEKIHYRMRSQFRVWHEDEELYFYMTDQDTKARIRVDQFSPASTLINKLMPRLVNEFKASPILRYKLFQANFVSSLSGEVMVSLLYHKPLDEEWLTAVKALKERLSNDFVINFIGRARKEKWIVDRDYVIEKLKVDGKELTYQQVENSFTQPNANVAIDMLEWAIDCTRNSHGDLLELYCGNGNFSLALAKNFNRVLATEVAKPAVHSAQYNITANNIDNVAIIRMSAQEFTQAINGMREFNRINESGIDLSSYECNTIFVDPPRAGLDDETIKMVQNYDHILYISCNPETLKSNLEQLTQTHSIKRLALFDQFPYTHHTEAGVFLVKN
jgi:tRNA (uracil-5-)-methyltransferase